MWPYRPISNRALRGGGGGEKDRDTGYLKGNPNFQFPQEIRQCLDMLLSGTLRMTKMNGSITTSSPAFLKSKESQDKTP
jgi:hypothetical protein